MKNLTAILTLALVTISSATMAQNFDVPNTGAVIYLADSEMDLAKGEYTFDLWIVKSKKAAKAKFDMPKFSGSDNLEISVTPNPADENHYKVTVKTKDVTSGQYFYTVTSRSNTVHRITGTTASFNVTDAKSVASADDK